MFTFLAIIQIIVCFVVIAVVLMQQRKQGGFSGVFGSGTQADMSGGQWQRFTALTKITVVLMSLFLIICTVLALMSK